MTRVAQTTLLRCIAKAVCSGAILVAATGCGVEVGPAYPVGYYDDYPPDAFIATATPVYYDGRPAYWYGNRWYYRDGGRWNHYDREPAVLYQRRTVVVPVRHNYEPSWGHHGGGHGGRR